MTPFFATFRTRREAQAAADAMKGWPSPGVDRLFYPDHPLATRAGNVWVVTATKGITTGTSKYLREDGTVQ
jgi:hypothetical protein